MGRSTEQFGGLSGRQMAMILGVDEHRVNQAADHALDVAAVVAMKNPASLFACLARRMTKPTRGMIEILRRRKERIERLRAAGELHPDDLIEETIDFELALARQTDRRVS